jgi:hypothetical protein
MTDGQSASLSWCGARIWSPWPDFFSVWQLHICPLWREDGSVIYCTIASGQSLSGPIPAELRPYFTVSSETSPTRRARSPYLYPPRNRVAQLHPRALGPLFVASYDSQGYDGGILTRLHTGQSRVTLRLTVSQSICLGVEPTLGLWPDIISHLKVSVGKLLSCLCGASSLTIGRDCHLPVSVCSNFSIWTLSMYISCDYSQTMHRQGALASPYLPKRKFPCC